jgi:hypothetical protein
MYPGVPESKNPAIKLVGVIYKPYLSSAPAKLNDEYLEFYLRIFITR